MANYTLVNRSAYNCSGDVNFLGPASAGRLAYPSLPGAYFPNMDCSFLLQVPDGYAVRVNFTRFETEAVNDVVTLRNGASPISPILNSYSGSTLPPVITSTASKVLLTFTSNPTNQFSGFELVYATVTPQPCAPSTVLTASTGTLVDKLDPGNYQPDRQCTWSIQAPSNSTVMVTFTSFYTVPDDDFVTLYDGMTTQDQVLGSFSGQLPLVFSTNSYSSSALLAFVSNAAINDLGWRATYEFVPRFCRGSRTLVAYTGTFSDHRGPGGTYKPNSDCGWLVQQILLTFTAFATESDADRVLVYAGPNASAPLAATLSGNIIPAPLQVSSTTAFVRFASNAAVESSGFIVSYTTEAFHCGGVSTLTGAYGYIATHYIQPEYSPNANCKWLIQPYGGLGPVLILFDGLVTESCCDKLRVYDGANEFAPLLGTYSGSVTGFSLLTTGPAAFLTFGSDGSNQGVGFRASYHLLAGYVINQTGDYACGYAAQDNLMAMYCPAGMVIHGILFSSYGTPAGSCPSYTNGGCSVNVTATLESQCLMQAGCSVMVSTASFGSDPCPSQPNKWLAVLAWCAPPLTTGLPLMTSAALPTSGRVPTTGLAAALTTGGAPAASTTNSLAVNTNSIVSTTSGAGSTTWLSTPSPPPPPPPPLPGLSCGPDYRIIRNNREMFTIFAGNATCKIQLLFVLCSVVV
eukprot:TRINITY_DN3915_c0_g1_i1.p1 TRINITY_DN3915_c0_g1~~TRINITY_DN3915_c0_g1_i1.p1  ORF type:complete len:688 (-),score=164.09 TRINITY_DN3915_c0_g1_i1:343-2406(-)